MQDAQAVEYILNAATVAIGLYMMYAYWTTSIPPVLSGLAFVIVGVSLVVSHWYRLG